jgi:hypothetical protein
MFSGDLGLVRVLLARLSSSTIPVLWGCLGSWFLGELLFPPRAEEDIRISEGPNFVPWVRFTQRFVDLQNNTVVAKSVHRHAVNQIIFKALLSSCVLRAG